MEDPTKMAINGRIETFSDYKMIGSQGLWNISFKTVWPISMFFFLGIFDIWKIVYVLL